MKRTKCLIIVCADGPLILLPFLAQFEKLVLSKRVNTE